MRLRFLRTTKPQKSEAFSIKKKKKIREIMLVSSNVKERVYVLGNLRFYEFLASEHRLW